MLVILLLISVAFSSSLKILQPYQLARQYPSGVVYNIGNIGHVPYGQKLIGEAVLSDPIDGCEPLKVEKDVFSSSFYVVKRGKCPFVTKVNYAQMQGAKLVIIIDTLNETDLQVQDDGFAYKLHIPTIVVNKDFGEKLITLLQEAQTDKSKNVMLEIEFEMIQQENVEVKFWLQMNDRDSARLVKEFQLYQSKLNNINYKPVYQLFNGLAYDHQEKICIGQSQYCMFQNDKGFVKNLTKEYESSYQFEIIRQNCVLKNYNDKFLEYFEKYNDFCFDKQDVVCSIEQMKKLNIDENLINNCIKESFGLDSNTQLTDEIVKTKQNKILNENVEAINSHQVHYWPSLTINGEEYRGNLDYEGTLDAICNGYKQNPPLICQPYVHQTVKQTKSLTGQVLLVIAVCLAFFSVAGWLIYNKFIKQEMHKDMEVQVNQMVSQYIAFYESKNTETRP